MKPFDLGWLVGIFEGEGCVWQRTGGNRPHPVIQVQMTDEDVVRRCYTITGLGHLYERSAGNTKRLVWEWRVSRYEDVVVLLERMLPHLGDRRRARVVELLRVAYAHPPRRLRTHCKRGHPLSGSNLRLYTHGPIGQRHRICRMCAASRAQRSRVA